MSVHGAGPEGRRGNTRLRERSTRRDLWRARDAEVSGRSPASEASQAQAAGANPAGPPAPAGRPPPAATALRTFPMVYLSRIYTKSGDTGQTGLGDGSRVDKDHPRVAAYGSVDELNSVLGLLLAQVPPPAEADLLRSI